MVAADRPYTRYQTDSSLLEGQVEPTGTQSVGGIKATLFRGNCPIEEQKPYCLGGLVWALFALL